MSATSTPVAPPKGLEFLPILDGKLPGKAVAEERPAYDVPTIRTDAANLTEVAKFLRDDPSAAYDLYLDLASVDLSRLPGAQAPKAGERFQSNVLLYSTKRNQHLRLRVNLPHKEPKVPSLVPVWAGANWFEREAWDLMGIDFTGHPNLKRLLTHNGFVGHPLRKDYDARQRWVCTEEDLLKTELAAQTDKPEDMFETMTLNFGPSQPATHGTLRIVMRLDGETIVAAEGECGYLHRNFEKMSEEHTYSQVFPYTDRLNYCSPMLNNNGWARAIESMLGVTPPPRAIAIRTILGEFSRVMDHLVCIAANLVDIGGLTNFWYAYQPREEIYGLLEACSGARLTISYGRIGGLAKDVPENFVPWCRKIIAGTRERIADVETLVNRNKIAWNRLRDTGVVTKEQALQWGWTGPCLRASGVPFDLRKDAPYEWYGEVDFDVPIMTEGDNYARYYIRLEEMKQSLRIIEQILDKLPGGPVRTDDYRVILPPKEMVYNEMEALIYHFKLVFEGVKVPPGEIYSYTEGANGELGFSVVSDGSGFPYRVKVRPPCFPLFASFEKIIKGSMVSDAVATLGLLNIIAGELDR